MSREPREAPRCRWCGAETLNGRACTACVDLEEAETEHYNPPADQGGDPIAPARRRGRNGAGNGGRQG